MSDTFDNTVLAKLPKSWRKSMEGKSEAEKRRLSRYMREAEEQYKEMKEKPDDKWAYIADIALRRFFKTGGPKSKKSRSKSESVVSQLLIAKNLLAIAKQLTEEEDGSDNAEAGRVGSTIMQLVMSLLPLVAPSNVGRADPDPEENPEHPRPLVEFVKGKEDLPDDLIKKGIEIASEQRKQDLEELGITVDDVRSHERGNREAFIYNPEFVRKELEKYKNIKDPKERYAALMADQLANHTSNR